MAKRKASSDFTDKHETATAETPAATESSIAPLPIETEIIGPSFPAARIEIPQLEPMAELLKIESFKARIKDDETAAAETAAEPAEAESPSWRRHAPLAASVALAAVLGAIAGAAATQPAGDGSTGTPAPEFTSNPTSGTSLPGQPTQAPAPNTSFADPIAGSSINGGDQGGYSGGGLSADGRS